MMIYAPAAFLCFNNIILIPIFTPLACVKQGGICWERGGTCPGLLVAEFRGMALNDRSLDLVPLTDFAYKYHLASNKQIKIALKTFVDGSSGS